MKLKQDSLGIISQQCFETVLFQFHFVVQTALRKSPRNRRLFVAHAMRQIMVIRVKKKLHNDSKRTSDKNLAVITYRRYC